METIVNINKELIRTLAYKWSEPIQRSKAINIKNMAWKLVPIGRGDLQRSIDVRKYGTYYLVEAKRPYAMYQEMGYLRHLQGQESFATVGKALRDAAISAYPTRFKPESTYQRNYNYGLNYAPSTRYVKSYLRRALAIEASR